MARACSLAPAPAKPRARRRAGRRCARSPPQRCRRHRAGPSRRRSGRDGPAAAAARQRSGRACRDGSTARALGAAAPRRPPSRAGGIPRRRAASPPGSIRPTPTRGTCGPGFGPRCFPVLAARLPDLVERLTRAAAQAAADARRGMGRGPGAAAGARRRSGPIVAFPLLPLCCKGIVHRCGTPFWRRSAGEIGVLLGARRLAAVDRLLASVRAQVPSTLATAIPGGTGVRSADVVSDRERVAGVGVADAGPGGDPGRFAFRDSG